MTFLTLDEKERIANAIRQAEQKTSGELVAVIAQASDAYSYIPLLWASLSALMLPGLLTLLGLETDQLMLIQFVVFSVCAVLFRFTPLKIKVIPKYVRQQRARRAAREQFFLQGLHETEKRNGILLYVSVAEHYVELIADKGINDVVVTDTWSTLVNEFVDKVKAGKVGEGYIGAIEQCGVILQTYFPAHEKDINELPNRLVEVGVPE